VTAAEIPGIIVALTALVAAVTALIASIRSGPILKSIHENTNNTLDKLAAKADSLQATQATAAELQARPSPKVP